MSRCVSQGNTPGASLRVIPDVCQCTFQRATVSLHPSHPSSHLQGGGWHSRPSVEHRRHWSDRCGGASDWHPQRGGFVQCSLDWSEQVDQQRTRSPCCAITCMLRWIQPQSGRIERGWPIVAERAADGDASPPTKVVAGLSCSAPARNRAHSAQALRQLLLRMPIGPRRPAWPLLAGRETSSADAAHPAAPAPSRCAPTADHPR
jgi:hypothetical protein